MTVERDFATVETAVSDSTELWARDLQALFEHARDRFGDVSWETELGSERIWGHKGELHYACDWQRADNDSCNLRSGA
jgi:hypothetical protein